MVRRRTSYRTYSLIVLIYLLIGVFVAFDRGYITVSLIKTLISAILAVLLWFLVLLGVDMRIG